MHARVFACWLPLAYDDLEDVVGRRRNDGEMIYLPDDVDEMIWPPHCVQNTAGADFINELTVCGVSPVTPKLCCGVVVFGVWCLVFVAASPRAPHRFSHLSAFSSSSSSSLPLVCSHCSGERHGRCCSQGDGSERGCLLGHVGQQAPRLHQVRSFVGCVCVCLFVWLCVWFLKTLSPPHLDLC